MLCSLPTVATELREEKNAQLDGFGGYGWSFFVSICIHLLLARLYNVQVRHMRLWKLILAYPRLLF